MTHFCVFMVGLVIGACIVASCIAYMLMRSDKNMQEELAEKCK